MLGMDDDEGQVVVENARLRARIAQLERDLELARELVEQEPVAWTLQWPEDGFINPETTFAGKERAIRYAVECGTPDFCCKNPSTPSVVPLYAKPMPPAPPEGMVQVPAEPTTTMWLAGQCVATYLELGVVTCMSGQQVEAIYMAMIDASQNDE